MQQQIQPARSGPPVAISVVIGRNRLRGKAEGAMVHDEFGTENLDTLRNTLRDEAKALGIDVTTEWITKAVSQMLRFYEAAYRAFQQRPGEAGVIGFIYEACLPSGKTLLLGDQIVLARALRAG